MSKTIFSTPEEFLAAQAKVAPKAASQDKEPNPWRVTIGNVYCQPVKAWQDPKKPIPTTTEFNYKTIYIGITDDGKFVSGFKIKTNKFAELASAKTFGGELWQAFSAYAAKAMASGHQVL